MNSVFDFQDYKSYLVALGDTRPRGFRKALADAIHCQTAYVSQVLNGNYHFSLEQAEAAARYLELSKDETHAFILLVEIRRAGTPTLRKFFEDQFVALRTTHQHVQERVGVSESLSREDEEVYYASWHYAAVHMAVTIPRLRRRTALGRALKMSARKLDDVLEFLLARGLLRKSGEDYLTGATQLHLKKDSASIHRHHTNWRTHALHQMHSEHAADNLHYSSVSSLSVADFQKIKGILSHSIGEAVGLIKTSPEEVLAGINIDLFRVDE